MANSSNQLPRWLVVLGVVLLILMALTLALGIAILVMLNQG
jgi:uncharacterized protein involved in cysteine biosynthesis